MEVICERIHFDQGWQCRAAFFPVTSFRKTPPDKSKRRLLLLSSVVAPTVNKTTQAGLHMTSLERPLPRSAGRLCSAVMFSVALSATFEAAFAQSTFATVQGTVLDTSGAVIPGAAITLVDEGTGVRRTVASDTGGGFRVFDLDAGTYTLVVSKAGFGDQTFPHQTVLARQVIRLDVSLRAGAVATEVEVNGGASNYSDIATVSHSLSSSDIDTLALNFRASDSTSPLYVATLTPGVQTDPSGNISVAGGFPYTTSYSIDGISTVNARFNGPSANLFPSVEAISEFKVNSANNDAEFGQPSDITVTTKAGTNQFHGGVYEFNQNSALNAANPVTRTQGPLSANDFGAYLGGPLSIPHLYNSKGKTFFFGDYEGTRRPESGSIAISVPSDAFRTGNFASLCTAGFVAGVCGNPKQQLYHPFSTVPYANNQVPVNASSAALLSALYPHATAAGLANNYNAAYPGNYTLNNGDVRLDENFNDRHHLWVRFGGKNVNLTGTDGSTTYDPANGTYVQPQRLRNFVSSYSWTISPKIVNELRGGYSVADFLTSYPLAGQGSSILAAAGITGLPAAPPSGGVPALNFTDGSFNTDNQDGRPHTTKNLTWNLSDQVTYAFGHHALKTGVDYQHYQFRDYLDFTAGDQYGDYYFSGQVTGYAFADFLAGFPVATDYSVDGPDVLPFAHSYGFYAQDSWKPLPNLTIDYGLRYEIHSPFNDATNQLANFVPTVPGGEVVVQGQAGLNQVLPVFRSSIGSTPIVTNTAANLPYTLRQTYYGDVDPRFGFTFDPFPARTRGKTVVHAGVGVYTVPVLGSVLYSLAGVATSNYLIFQDSATQILQFPNVFPTGGGAGQAGLPDYRRANQIDLKDPRQIQWNGSIEQGIGFQSVVRLSYTGSHTTQLIQSPDLNQVPANTLGYAAYKAKFGVPFPNFNAVLTRSNGPSAKYQAFTAEVERRYVKGLALNASYTFAHDVSNALGAVPTTLTAENGATILDRFNEDSNYGNVIYVRRNRFVGTFQYDLPYGRGQRFGNTLNPAESLLLGGWGIAGIQLWQSGPFLTPSFSGTDPSGTGVLVRGVTTAQRPDCTGLSAVLPGHSRANWFNAAAFSTPGNNIGRFGNCPVGRLVGPGTVSFAGTLGKNFALTERFKLRYEAQVANLFNHVNLGIPNTNISSSSFGTISNVQDATTSYGPSAGPRNVQMSLRLTF